MKFGKYIFTAIVFFNLMFSGARAQDFKVLNEVLAVVGDNAILLSDVEEAYIRSMIEGRTSNGDLKCELFEELLYNRLLLNQAQIDSLEVTDEEVKGNVERNLSQYIMQFGSEQAIEEQFKKPMAEIKQDLFPRMKDHLLVQKMEMELTRNIKITPTEIKNYYKDLNEAEIPLIPETLEIQQIVFKPKITLEEKEAVKDRLKEMKKRIMEGERSFETMAVVYSEDPGSAMKNGELGFVSRTQLDPAFSKTAFSLQPDEISPVIKSEFGYHIIKLVERRGDFINVKHILLVPKPSGKALQNAYSSLDSLTNEVRAGKISMEKAAEQYSEDDQSKNNGGLMVNFTSQMSPNLNSPRFFADELPEDIYKEASKLKIGELSEPFKIQTRTGVEYVVIKVKSRINAHKAKFDTDYQLIKRYAQEQKNQETLKKWVNEKQKKTYIRISDSYKNCDFVHKGWIK